MKKNRKPRPRPQLLGQDGKPLHGTSYELPTHERIQIRTKMLTCTDEEGSQRAVKLQGTPETIGVIESLIDQVSLLQGLLDSRGRHESEEREPWQPFEQAPVVYSDLMGATPAGFGDCITWVNNHYHVGRYPTVILYEGTEAETKLIHLSIRRNDRTACHDWRDFQRIKNELAGPDWEAVELYPAEQRLVDGANQYHLWCIDKPFPFGFDERMVSESTEGGVTQRAWRDDERPDDLTVVTREDMHRAIRKLRGARDDGENQPSTDADIEGIEAEAGDGGDRLPGCDGAKGEGGDAGAGPTGPGHVDGG